MKKLKIVLCFLFVTAVTNKLFSQDYHVLSSSFAIGYYNKKLKQYALKPRYIEDTDIHFTKYKITMNDVFNTKFDIVKRDTAEVSGQKFEFFHCKDNQGVFCLFIPDKDEDNNDYYTVKYDNCAYFYYTKK